MPQPAVIARDPVTPSLLQNIVIRHLSPCDSIEELTELLHRAYKPLADAGMRYVATWQTPDITEKRIRKGECYVVSFRGRVIATAVYMAPNRTKGSPWYDRMEVAMFGQFAVEPEFQGSGVGGVLMDYLERVARRDAAEELALDTSEHAAHLIAWYGKRGYRFVEHVQWESVNYRSVILSKRLTPAG